LTVIFLSPLAYSGQLPYLGQLPYPGELAALAAALLWAVSSVVYADLGDRLSATWLNFLKGLVAIGLVAVTVLILGLPWVALPIGPLLALLASGIFGIGIGDTCYFKSINALGPRRALVIESLAPPLAAILAFLAFGETLAPSQLIGIALTIGGVAWVVSEQQGRTTTDPQWLSGISYGITAALCQAIGVTLSRWVLLHTAIDPLWATLLRLLIGCTVLGLSLAIRNRRLDSPRPILTRRTIGIIAIASFFSTYLGIWLQQLSLKYTAVGISQTLTSTSQLFMVPIAILRREPLTRRSILGAAIAMAGIVLLFL
jgi:drug/metabolite transporter (DMT)-like permease